MLCQGEQKRSPSLLLLFQLSAQGYSTMALRLAASRTVTGLSRSSAFAASFGHGELDLSTLVRGARGATTET